MICAECGKEIPDSAKFCYYCGTAQSIDKDPGVGLCSSCGKGILPGAKFCRHCGTKLMPETPNKTTTAPDDKPVPSGAIPPKLEAVKSASNQAGIQPPKEPGGAVVDQDLARRKAAELARKEAIKKANLEKAARARQAAELAKQESLRKASETQQVVKPQKVVPSRSDSTGSQGLESNQQQSGSNEGSAVVIEEPQEIKPQVSETPDLDPTESVAAKVQATSHVPTPTIPRGYFSTYTRFGIVAGIVLIFAGVWLGKHQDSPLESQLTVQEVSKEQAQNTADGVATQDTGPKETESGNTETETASNSHPPAPISSENEGSQESLRKEADVPPKSKMKRERFEQAQVEEATSNVDESSALTQDAGSSQAETNNTSAQDAGSSQHNENNSTPQQSNNNLRAMNEMEKPTHAGTVTNTVYPTSFNCSTASIRAENLVCSSRELAEADLKLDGLYKEKLKATLFGFNKNAIKKNQKKWLNNIRNSCQDENCLIEAYRKRINRFEQAKADDDVDNCEIPGHC